MTTVLAIMSVSVVVMFIGMALWIREIEFRVEHTEEVYKLLENIVKDHGNQIISLLKLTDESFKYFEQTCVEFNKDVEDLNSKYDELYDEYDGLNKEISKWYEESKKDYEEIMKKLKEATDSLKQTREYLLNEGERND